MPVIAALVRAARRTGRRRSIAAAIAAGKLDGDLPRDLRADVLALPLHDRALVPPTAASPGAARGFWPWVFGPRRRSPRSRPSRTGPSPSSVSGLFVSPAGAGIAARFGRPPAIASARPPLPSRSGSSTACSLIVSTWGRGRERIQARIAGRRLAYLVQVAGDFTVGWAPTVVVVLTVALVGAGVLARSRPDALVLAGAVILVPQSPSSWPARAEACRWRAGT